MKIFEKMKIISWNVNGIRACLGKGFKEFVKAEDPDLVCIQETKAQPEQVDLSSDFPEYFEYWNSAEKKGYSGTLILAKKEALSVRLNIDAEGHDKEGRAITLEYPDFYMVTNYTPNSQQGLARLGYRLSWEAANRKYLKILDETKPVILCGDLNVAHEEIDLKDPDSNHESAGFSDEERDAFSELLDLGFTDSFRSIYPNKADAYTWWSYRTRARERNAGWRIDYFVVSNRLLPKVIDVVQRTDIYGSDHCPVILEIDLSLSED